MIAALRHNSATQGVPKDMLYLYTRNGVYYFRRRVPSEFVGVIDSNRFHFSLATKDHREAIKRRALAIAETDFLISKERERVQKHSGSLGVTIPFKAGPPSAADLRRRNAERDKRHYGRSFYEYQNSDIIRIAATWFQNAKRNCGYISGGIRS